MQVGFAHKRSNQNVLPTCFSWQIVTVDKISIIFICEENISLEFKIKKRNNIRSVFKIIVYKNQINRGQSTFLKV